MSSKEPRRDPSQQIAPLRSNTAVPPEDKDAELGLELLRGMVEQELIRAERSATRARQVFALAAAFFALVSTVAFTSFANTFIGEHERHVLLWLAGLGGICLALCGGALLVADRAFRGSNLTSDDVVNTLNERPDEPAALRFVELFAGAVDGMRDANGRRGQAVLATQIFGLATIGAALAELIYALYARLS